MNEEQRMKYVRMRRAPKSRGGCVTPFTTKFKTEKPTRKIQILTANFARWKECA